MWRSILAAWIRCSSCLIEAEAPRPKTPGDLVAPVMPMMAAVAMAMMTSAGDEHGETGAQTDYGQYGKNGKANFSHDVSDAKGLSAE